MDTPKVFKRVIQTRNVGGARAQQQSNRETAVAKSFYRASKPLALIEPQSLNIPQQLQRPNLDGRCQQVTGAGQESKELHHLSSASVQGVHTSVAL